MPLIEPPPAALEDLVPDTPQPSTSPPERLHIDERAQGEVAVLVVTGEVDPLTAPALTDALARAIAAGATAVDVDLDGVTFLDSSGLRTLVSAHRLLRERSGHLRLCRLRPAARRILAVTGLDAVLLVDDAP